MSWRQCHLWSVPSTFANTGTPIQRPVSLLWPCWFQFHTYQLETVPLWCTLWKLQSGNKMLTHFIFLDFEKNVIVVPSSHRTQEGSWAFCSYVCQPIRVTALCCPQHAWVHPHTHLIPKGHVCCSQLRLLCSYFSGERPPTENTPLAMEAKGVADHRGLQKAHALLGLLCSTNGDHVQENSFAILLCYYNENTKSIHCSFTCRPNSNSKVSSQ